MRERIVLAVSLALNVLLALSWGLSRQKLPARRPVPPRHAAPATNVLRLVRTNVVVQPVFFSWREVESADYLTYIRNLRSVGCPENTIRDIVVADVNQLFAKRRAVEIATASHQWWRADPDPDLLEETVDGIQSLERERRALLATLLGPHWESPDELLGVPATSIAFTGPQLGSLPAEAKWAVCDIEARSREQLRAHTAAQEKDGKPVDPAFTARLRQQTREELAKVLTPEQLEEYLLRYSRNADRLRETVRGFDATAEEFRKLFRATDPLDQQLDTLGASADAATERRRAELQRQRDEAARQALGDKRYEFYRLNQDPVFQDVRETAEQLGADAASVLPLYQIQKEVARERNRILQDASLSPEDQSRELGLVYQHQLDSVRKLMGEEAFKKYQALSGR